MRNGRIEKTKNKFSVISFIRIISILVILVCIGLLVYRYINLKNSDKILGEINIKATTTRPFLPYSTSNK